MNPERDAFFTPAEDDGQRESTERPAEPPTTQENHE